MTLPLNMALLDLRKKPSAVSIYVYAYVFMCVYIYVKTCKYIHMCIWFFLISKICIYNTSAQGSAQSGTLIRWHWINQHWSQSECVPAFKIECIVCANLPAMVHCSPLPGLIQWEWAPDALRMPVEVSALGVSTWASSLQPRDTQTVPALEAGGQVSWHAPNPCFHADMAVTLRTLVQLSCDT